jgi:uncharacterized protein (DUF362 family)
MLKKQHSSQCNRRQFLQWTSTAAALAPFWHSAGEETRPLITGIRANAKVAIVPCRTYGLAELKVAFQRSFDLLGGLGRLVRQKSVTIKINLTGTSFVDFQKRPVGETYMTHGGTVLVLTKLLFDAGARRVRFVESTLSRSNLENSMGYAGFDVKALQSLGTVEFENTRNLGMGKRYVTLPVPSGGNLFSAFDFNHSYADTDVMVSLCKLKNHVTAGITLSMKNLFGITPSSLYGEDAGKEDAVGGRSPIHGPDSPQTAAAYGELKLPGLKGKYDSIPRDGGYRVPRTIVDICGARPIDLAIIDGISSIEGGEGPWCAEVNPVKVITPGLLITGLNPVSTDAVGTAVMGYPNPRARRGTPPFDICDNQILMAEEAGLGVADLKQIEVLGQPIEKSVCQYHMNFSRMRH